MAKSNWTEMDHTTMEVSDHVKGPKWALGLVMMILGLLLTTQFRIQKQVIPNDPGRIRAEEMVAALNDKEVQLQAVTQERDQLKAEVERLRASLTATAPPPREDSSALETLAGTVEVSGPGVVVILVETPESIAAKNRVADEDIWRVLNELFTAGAEAVSVNGVRVTPVTGVRNVGNRILVGQTMIASPVEIHAVGDPTVLDQAMKLRGGVIEMLSRWGIKATSTKSDDLKIPATGATPTFRYAKPVETNP